MYVQPMACRFNAAKISYVAQCKTLSLLKILCDFTLLEIFCKFIVLLMSMNFIRSQCQKVGHAWLAMSMTGKTPVVP